MALQPLSIGDILMLSQTAWKIGRAFAHGKKSAPYEFAEVEREANGLSDALKLVAEALHTDNSILFRADQETKSAVNTILESAHKTLSDLESFVERYQVIKKQSTKGGFVVERQWSDVVMTHYKTFKWTTEGGDITALRDMLQMHTSSLNLTMQALQSQSLARLENTVVPMAENISSIYERVNGDLGDKITELHALIMSLARNRTPSLRERSIDGRPHSFSEGSIRESIGAPPTGLIEGSPVSNLSYYQGNHHLRVLDAPNSHPAGSDLMPRPLSARKVSSDPPPPTLKITPVIRSMREDSAVESFASGSMIRDHGSSTRHDDWRFESGSPDRQPSICADPDVDYVKRHPDSGYVSWTPASRPTSHTPRRSSGALPIHVQAAVKDEIHDAGESSSAHPPFSVSPRARTYSRTSAPGSPPMPAGSPPLPPPALGHGQDESQDQLAETPSSFFAKAKRRQSSGQSQGTKITSNFETPIAIRAPSVQAVPKSVKRQPSNYAKSSPSVCSDGQSFERNLFRNAAILCDVRGKLVEYAQLKPDETDPRFNIEMVEACKDARICVVRKRENREHGGTKVVTSVWCLSDDGDHRIQQKLSEVNETVPFCSYFEPEKVSLPPTDGVDIMLKFHDDVWGAMLLEEKKTNWVNYYFASANDAVAFQSAVFGRLLIGSYRTTKTTVIHDGLKGAFAFEEQFANIEMLRLWEDDGVATPGAAGGVLALTHFNSSFGDGWARWWVNNREQPIRVKPDGLRHAKVRGIDVTVVKPRPVPTERIATPATNGRRPTGDSLVRSDSVSSHELRLTPSAGATSSKKNPIKRVNGVRIEFKTDAEREQFLSMVKRVQSNLLTLPDF